MSAANVNPAIKVTFLIPGYPWRPWGALRVVYEYANQLANKGHKVCVAHVRRLREPNTFPLKGINARIRRVLRETRDFLFDPEVKWQPIDERVDLLYISKAGPKSIPDGDMIFATAWDTVADVLALPESKGKKCFLVQAYDTWSGKQERVDSAWRAPLRKVVVAKWLYENGRRLGCDDMVYIPNGIDRSRFRAVAPIEVRPKRVAVRYSAPAFRGMAEAVEALQIAREKHPDLQAVFFGTISAPAWIPKWIKYWENPAQNDLIEKIYNGSSIFILSSWTEAFALPPMEAMLCGCALVTTACGGIDEYAKHGINSLVSPPMRPQLLAENLLRLLDDDQLRIKLARLGEESISRFTWVESGNRMGEFISQAVQDHTERKARQ